MSFSYRVYNQYEVYFITCTVHQWVDVFTRNEYKRIVLDSLMYCQQHKGLLIYAWVIMSNHVHLIIGTEKDKLSDIIRDFKKYTATKVFMAIKDNPLESRKNWLLWLLSEDDKITFWQEGYHGKEVVSRIFYLSKEQYIHQNPIRAGLVLREEEYVFSSCPDRIAQRENFPELSLF